MNSAGCQAPAWERKSQLPGKREKPGLPKCCSQAGLGNEKNENCESRRHNSYQMKKYSDSILCFCRRRTQTDTDRYPKTDIRRIRKKYAAKNQNRITIINFLLDNPDIKFYDKCCIADKAWIETLVLILGRYLKIKIRPEGGVDSKNEAEGND